MSDPRQNRLVGVVLDNNYWSNIIWISVYYTSVSLLLAMRYIILLPKTTQDVTHYHFKHTQHNQSNLKLLSSESFLNKTLDRDFLTHMYFVCTSGTIRYEEIILLRKMS